MSRLPGGKLFGIDFGGLVTVSLAGLAFVVCLMTFSLPVLAGPAASRSGAIESGKVWTGDWTGGVQASGGSVPISGEIAISVVFGVAWAAFLLVMLFLWLRISRLEKAFEAFTIAMETRAAAENAEGVDDADQLSDSESGGVGRMLVLEEIDI